MESAQDRFTEMLATGRNTGDAYYYLGNIAERQEDYPRALRLYARVGTGPNVIAAQIRAASVLEELDDGQAGLDHLQGFADANPRHRSTMAMAKGNLLVRMDRGDDAFVWYDEYLTEYPDDNSVRYQRAFLYERLDRVDEAIAELHRILDGNTNDPFALNALGYTLADRTTRYREAQRYIKKAYSQAPYNAAIVDSMGWIMYRRGKLDQALEYLQRAYRLDDDPEIAAHLGEVLWVSGDETAANEIWQGALKVYPDNELLQEIVEQFVN
jgi:tetratricopeptide (TPR) repeat protein